MTRYDKIEQMINKNNDTFNIKEYNLNLYVFILNALLEIDKMFYLDSFEIYILSFPFPSSEILSRIYIREYQFGFNIFAIEYGMNNSGLTVNDFVNKVKVCIEKEHMRMIRKDI